MHTPRRAAAAALVTSVLVLAGALSTLGVGGIQHRGRRLRMPVPYPSLEIASSEDRATYLTLGYPDIGGTFLSRGGRFGWKFVDQFGGGFIIVSTPREDLRLSAVTELETRFCTKIAFRLDELPE